jgi:hypothetical protein
MSNHESRPFRGLRAPRAPEALRERALDAARRAMDAPPATLWERAWESRAARLAWAASVLLLLGGHAALSLWPRGAAARAGDSPLMVRGEQSTSAELAEIVAIPRIHPAAAAVGAGLSNGEAARPQSPSTQEHSSAPEGRTS